jgi:L-lactate dehydrogenase
MIIGGHGHNNLPLWSSVTVGGIHLLSENPTMGKPSDKENWGQLHAKVNQRVEEINRVKGTEVWSIGMACSELVECILRNKREIHPVTVNIKGYYQVTNDLFLSIPAIIGEHGVSHLITTNFDRHHLNESDFSNIIESITAMVHEKLTRI